MRKQGAAKQAVAAQLHTEVPGHDEAVLEVCVKFSRQLMIAQKKEAIIQDSREERELERILPKAKRKNMLLRSKLIQKLFSLVINC